MKWDPELANVLSIQLEEANNIVRKSQSERLKTIFQETWSKVGYGSISANVAGEKLTFDASIVMDTINNWIRNLRICQDDAINNYYALENPTNEDFYKKGRIQWGVYDVISYYEELKTKVENADMEFANAVRYYRSPMRQALNDMRIMYNSIKNIKGDFSGFENVSVYIHGIESTGEEFLESVTKAGSVDEVIITIMRDGTRKYSVINMKEGEKNRREISHEELMLTGQLNNKESRLHIVYETEHENEHRQETSDDLAIKLTELGLMSDSTMIDMFAHSYGGRRSFQFAIDYPDRVRSITTIGTPYDTNTLAKAANKLPWNWTEKVVGKNPSQYSDYLDFNLENKRNDSSTEHSNAYTDMTSEPLSDDINRLKVANPEIYHKLNGMDITAVAGYRSIFIDSNHNPRIMETSSDDVVSIESQQGDLLGSIIDVRLKYEVQGSGLLFNQGHINEIEDAEFINLIRSVNYQYTESESDYE